MPKKRDILKTQPAKVIKGGKGGKLPEPDLSLVPRLTGESKAVNFRCDAVTEADIVEHWERLEERALYATVTLSDALRSLIQEGARSYRLRFADDETTNGKK